MSLLHIPSFSRWRDTWTPGSDVSTMNRLMPRWPEPGSVCATNVRKCARVPLVMNIFVPVMRQTSPSRSARVRIAATSEPASGSVIAMAPIFSPAIAGRSQRSRCASEPKCASAGVAMSDCTEIAIAIGGRTRARQFLDEHDARGEVAVAAAPLRRIVQAEEAEFAAPPEQLVGEAPGRFPLVDERSDLGVDETAHRCPQGVVFRREDRMRGRFAGGHRRTVPHHDSRRRLSHPCPGPCSSAG